VLFPARRVVLFLRDLRVALTSPAESCCSCAICASR
jgi:hypothetical protein